MLSEIKYLFLRELQLEWRNKTAFSGLLLYIASTIFVAYIALNTNLGDRFWNALFWIILLFAAVNANAKSFMSEGEGRKLYLYTLANPQAVILAKICYNAVLLTVLGILSWGIYSLVMGNPVEDQGQFAIGLVFGCTGLASTLTLISAIAAQSGNNPTLMAILGFPVILPLLLTIVAFSFGALIGNSWEENNQYLLALLGLNGVVIALSYILFPYLWRD